jgi:uncharacterized metal-binding protein YceD (DUF177 family)
MGKKHYLIKFGGLPVGTHEFEFRINGSFFEQFNESEITEADIDVTVILLKQNHLMQMEFEINGTVNLACDRCLISYDFPVRASEKLVIKYGNEEESTDEIIAVNESSGEADISHYLFEYITLALPSRRVPCEVDEEFECDYETLNKLNESSTEEEVKDANPVWEELNKLKKINKN